jgi:virginiamycin B lyase
MWNATALQTTVCNNPNVMLRLRHPRSLAAAVLVIACAPATSARAVTIAQHALPGTASPAVAIAPTAGGLAITRAELQSTLLERVATAPAFSAGRVQPLGALALAGTRGGELWLLAVSGPAGNVLLERAPESGAAEPSYPFALPLGSAFFPEQLTQGPDGSWWIANMTGERIERLAPSGQLGAFALARDGAPTSIALAPDGSAWFTELATGMIGEVTPTGLLLEHPLEGAPAGAFGNAEPYSIALGPDGALWFTEENAGRIGRITTAGSLEEFTIPDTAGVPQGDYGSPQPRYISAGPDGTMWFTDGGDDSIGRITTSGQISEYPIGTPTPASPQGIVSQGGLLWFAEAGLRAIGSVDPNGVPPRPSRPPASKPRSATRRRRCRARRAHSSHAAHPRCPRPPARKKSPARR